MNKLDIALYMSVAWLSGKAGRQWGRVLNIGNRAPVARKKSETRVVVTTQALTVIVVERSFENAFK